MDGSLGANTRKALKAFQRAHGLKESGKPDGAVWDQLASSATEPPLVEYIIADKDVAEPFEPKIPDSLEEKAKLEHLGYTGPDELLAEKFHMDIGLLKRLNRGKQFDQAGVSLQVANIGRPRAGKAARLEVDKKIGGVFVFDRQDAIIAFFPATIGSEETPSPSGKVTITRISRNPTYTYDPEAGDPARSEQPRWPRVDCVERTWLWHSRVAATVCHQSSEFPRLRPPHQLGCA